MAIKNSTAIRVLSLGFLLRVLHGLLLALGLLLAFVCGTLRQSDRAQECSASENTLVGDQPLFPLPLGRICPVVFTLCMNCLTCNYLHYRREVSQGLDIYD